MEKEEIKKRAEELENAFQSFRRLKFSHKEQKKISSAEKYTLFLISQLSQGTPVSASDISKKLHISGAAVTHHLNALEDAGLIKREVSKKDRRVSTISISNKGRKKIKEVKKKHFRIMSQVVEQLGDRDSKKLLILIKKILDYFSNQVD